MTSAPRFRQKLFVTLTAVIFASLVLQSWVMYRVGEAFLGISDAWGFLIGGFVPLLWQALPLILIFAGLLVRRLGFLNAVVGRLHRREELPEADVQQAKRDLLKIPLWVYGINLAGYTVGIVVQAVLYPARVLSVTGILEILFNFASAGMFAAFLMGLFNLILAKVRELLQVTRIDEGLGKRRKMHNQNFVLAFFLCTYLILFSLMVGVRYTNAESEYAAALQRVLSGEDRASVSKQYYDNLRKSYPSIGKNTKDDLLAIAPAADTAGNFFTPLFFLLAALASGMWWVSTRFQSSQLVKLRDRLLEALKGGNLTTELGIVQFDEVGELAGAINQLMQTQNERLRQLTRAAVSVEQAARPLPGITEMSRVAAVDIQSSSSRIEEVSEREIASVQEAETRLEQALKSFDDILVSVDAQSLHVSSASSAMTEMASSIASVTKTTQEAKNLAERLKTNSLAGTKALASSVVAIQAIETASQEVDKLTAAIAKISAQTNLLAMNAAIEAAHAGDTGMGFAVVAEEVRELAMSSSESNKKIKRKIADMLALVENGVHLSTEVGQSFEKINEDIAITAALVSEIASAMQEQNVGTDQILVSTSALVEASSLIRETAGVQKEHNLQLKDAVARITGSFETIRSGAEVVAQDSKKIQDAVGRLETFSDENNRVVENLASVVQSMGGSAAKESD